MLQQEQKTTWLVWGLRVFFLDLPFPPSPVWVVLGAELGCVRAAGTSFDQLPEACGAGDRIGVFLLDLLPAVSGGAEVFGSGGLELLWCSILELQRSGLIAVGWSGLSAIW
ncbi:hypothetical protein ACOSQ4_007418 [Xanthoceras sorbifolium]